MPPTAGGPDLRKDSIPLRVLRVPGRLRNRAGASPTLGPPDNEGGKPRTPAFPAGVGSTADGPNAAPCYNDLALSCLAVSGGLPFFIRHLCLAQISPSPYSVTTRVSPWAGCHGPPYGPAAETSFAARSRLINA